MYGMGGRKGEKQMRVGDRQGPDDVCHGKDFDL